MQCRFVAKNNTIPTKRELNLFFKCKKYFNREKVVTFVLPVNLVLPFGCGFIIVKFITDLLQQLNLLSSGSEQCVF